QRLLAWRRTLGAVFAHGDYRPLAVEGPHHDQVIAFARVHGEDAAIVIAGRHFAALTEGGRRWPRPEDWQGHVRLGSLTPTDRLPLASAFAVMPVAVLRAHARDAAVTP